MRNEFLTTRWSVVLAAGDREAPESGRALADLCESYWYPLYAFARRKGRGPEEAGDLTQGFFAELLEKDFVRAADPERGRFRAFLLTAFKRYLIDEREKERAQKRGGGRRPLPLDFDDGEKRFSREPSHDLTPEREFERRWALLLLERVLDRLGHEMEKAGREEQYAELRPFLTAAADTPRYAEVAARLRTTEGAVKVSVHRIRRRYRDLLRREIAETVSSPEEVEDEIHHLLTALA